MNKKGFTLAEVLITLGVIGVVAAITLPPVITNYQKKNFGIRAEKAYTTLYQAIKMSEAQNGELSEWNFNLSNDKFQNGKLFIEKYIQPYVKEMKYCDTGMTNNKCAKYVGCGASGINYYLPYGEMLGVCAYPEDNTIYLNIGLNKNPKSVRGVFSCSIDKRLKAFVPAHYRPGLSRESILNGYSSSNGYNVICSKTSKGGYYNYACSALLYVDNFEVTDDYPW